MKAPHNPETKIGQQMGMQINIEFTEHMAHKIPILTLNHYQLCKFKQIKKISRMTIT
jgi:hypothetical protein